MDMVFLEIFYLAVVKAVLRFGEEIWVLSDTMLKNIEGVNVGFLQQVPGEKARRQNDGY